MPPTRVPYRGGYKCETQFPRKRTPFLKKGSLLLKPLHGAGPRCRVDYSPEDDGPWTMVQIMRIDGEIEHFTCAMPRYYAVPLILLNKRLSYFEAQCAPDGTPLPRGDGSHGLSLRELKEYTYLWRLRTSFLQSLFDMNHEQQLDETWQCDRIHGYVHRTYKRYGHDMIQRHTYWKDELEAGRTPYATPGVAEMDWGAFLAEEMNTSTRLNAFLWNRVSQGYARLVQDGPPYASWRAWRRGGPSRDLSAALYRTPPPPSVPSTTGRSGVSEVPDSTTEEDGVEVVETVEEGGETDAAAAEASRSASRGNSDAIRCSATIFDYDNETDCGDGQAVNLDSPSVRALQLPSPSRGASPAAGSTTGTAEPGHRRILFALDVPNGVAVTDLLCQVSRVEDVGDEHQTRVRVQCNKTRRGQH